MGLARHAAAIAALPALLLALHGCATGERNVAPVPAARKADAIVYGGTSAGVAAAVRLARLGREVVLLSPDVHLGGLSSSGLGWTDTGEKSVIGGLAREFYGRIFEHYARDEAWRWQARDEYGNRGQGTPAIDGAQGLDVAGVHLEAAKPAIEPRVANHLNAGLRDQRLEDRFRDVGLEDPHRPALPIDSRRSLPPVSIFLHLLPGPGINALVMPPDPVIELSRQTTDRFLFPAVSPTQTTA